MSAVTATQMNYAYLGRNTSPRCNVDSRNNVSAIVKEMGVTLAQRRRCGTSDSAFLHLCNLSGLLDLVILHERARGESEIPATALDVFTDKADPAWDDLMLDAKRFSCRDRCV